MYTRMYAVLPRRATHTGKVFNIFPRGACNVVYTMCSVLTSVAKYNTFVV